MVQISGVFLSPMKGKIPDGGGGEQQWPDVSENPFLGVTTPRGYSGITPDSALKGSLLAVFGVTIRGCL